MPEVNRRRFLQLAGATTAFTALSNSIERAAALPAHHRTGTIEDVEHIVVLMQENRSFDHYFGALRGVRGFGDPHPVTLDSGKSVWHQSDGTKDLLPFHPEADDLGMEFLEGLPHSWPDGHVAYNGGKYDKWVPAKGATTMAYLTREDIPFHYALADRFTVCDAYHCSFIGSTDPNRYYMWTGYTGNDGKGGGPVLGNDEVGYDWTTYPERLEQAGISWKIYQDIGDGLDAAGSWGWIQDAYRGNYGDNSLLYFNKYRNAKPGDPWYDKARTGTDVKNGDGYFDRLKADVTAGTLPQISWITAPEAFSEHSNWPSNYGAWYISQVLDALTANPEVWAKTALFITYDENDGFFDHLVPPLPPKSAAQGKSTVDVEPDLYKGDANRVAGPYGLGPRVPMVVVSPWSKGGYAAPRPWTTRRSSGSWSSASACASPTSRRGAGPSAVTSPPPSTSPARTRSRSRCRRPTATSRRTVNVTPTTNPLRRPTCACPSRSAVCAPPARSSTRRWWTVRRTPPPVRSR